MEGHGQHPRIWSVVALTFCCLIGASTPAQADAPRADTGSSDASGHTDGATVVLHFIRQADGSGRRTTDDGCEWFAVPAADIQEFQEVPRPPSSGPADGDGLFVVWSSCGSPASFVWLGADAFDDPARPIAEELVRRLTVGDSAIQVRPDSRGITGIPSYFWIEGYGDAPLQGTESAFGLTVAVTIRLAGVDWDFGDDTPVVHAGLGEAWPERSSVEHNYRYSSTEPYTVTATLRFQPTYTVNGIAGAPLEPITIPTTRPYLVHQLQAERTR
jgi:hypothetical protein